MILIRDTDEATPATKGIACSRHQSWPTDEHVFLGFTLKPAVMVWVGSTA